MLLHLTSKSGGLYNLPTDDFPIHADTDYNPSFPSISQKMTVFRKTSATSISSLFDGGDHPPRSTTASPIHAAIGLSNPQMSGQQRRMLDRINELHNTG